MDAVFIAGGDGTINRAISGLIGSQTALAVLPTGTANVWAKELGLPVLTWGNWLAFDESARRLVDGVIRVVDVGFCANTPFLLWASVGLDACVVHQLEPRKRWEKYFAVPKYAAVTVREAYSWPGMDLRIKIENETIHGQYLLAVVTNIHLYAGGLAELSPEARIDDGRTNSSLGDYSSDIRRTWLIGGIIPLLGGSTLFCREFCGEGSPNRDPRPHANTHSSPSCVARKTNLQPLPRRTN